MTCKTLIYEYKENYFSHETCKTLIYEYKKKLF